MILARSDERARASGIGVGHYDLDLLVLCRCHGRACQSPEAARASNPHPDAATGTPDVDGLGAFSYQWYRDGVAIGGATSSTYTLNDTDVGSTLI